ncbi:hypothetical protein [Vallitalea sp.]|jgi:cell division protein FtsB|uniref:hypothetical protein n=1 Tax=Vallitalea sp. TaxID=1882829 RepID=UPI0025D95105|nr:hypothetical protein [Vallitalea sp.]MCT4688195.1 hypothetical protein [Vallitalea sp.]
MSKKQHYNTHNQFYVIGNNAAKLERDYNTYNRDSINENNLNEVRRNKAQRRVVKRYKYKLKFSLILCLTMVMCLIMIKTQFTVSDRCDNIVALENRLNNLKKNNKLIEESINANIDLNIIYEIATTKLGMVVPSKNQINKLNVAQNSYTEQLTDITKPTQQNNDFNKIVSFILTKGR